MIRRAILGLALTSALLTCVYAQEQPAKSETQAEDPMTGWKWANFLILAAGLGYLIGKAAPPMFRKQSGEIQAALAEAAKIKQDAEAYHASVAARLSNLQQEIEKLKQSARTETAAEGERIRRDTEKHLQRIQEQSVQEIGLMTRAAKDELRKYASELALALAADRVRYRMTEATQESLVGGFVNDLNRRATPASN